MANQHDQQQNPALLEKTIILWKNGLQLQSEVLLLTAQLKSKKNYFLKEITFLREQSESTSSSARYDKVLFCLLER